MRIIDADAIDWSIVEDEYGKRTDSVVACEILIENQTTIDAVEVVRCKDCKHRYDDGWLEPRWTCDYLKDMRLKDDDFCSYGERKESE